MMKMNKIALSVALITLSGHSMAADVYKDQQSKLQLNTEIAVGLIGGKKIDTDVSQFDSTIALYAERDIDYRTKIIANVEFDANILDSDESSFSTKQGYIGAKHDKLGEVYIGTKKSPHFVAAEAVDKNIAFSPAAFESADEAIGTGYAERQVSAYHKFSLDNDGKYGDLSIAVALQPETEIEFGSLGKQSLDLRTQFGLTYDIDAFTISYVNLSGDIDTLDEDLSSHLVAAQLGTYGKGLYLGAAFTKGNFTTTDLAGEYLAESDGINAIAAYGFPNKLTLSVSYEHLNTGDDTRGKSYSDKTAYSKSTIQAEYGLGKNTTLFAGYQVDLDGTGSFETNGEKDHQWAIGAKIAI